MTEKSLKHNVADATARAFEQALKEIGADELCGFALSSDESAMTLVASVNTRTHWKAASRKNPDNAAYLRFAPAEWKVEGYADPLFDEVNAMLEERYERYAHKESEKQFEAFANGFFSTCVDALLAAKKGVSGLPADFVFVFDIADFDDTAQLVRWMRRLNGARAAKEFATTVEA